MNCGNTASTNSHAFGLRRQVSRPWRKIAASDRRGAVPIAPTVIELRTSVQPIQAMYSEPATIIAVETAGTRRDRPVTKAVPNSVWQAPPSMMPAVAASPARLPPESALASTNSMSMPGTTTMPRTRTK
ncbi:MAG: hypothetical protein BGN94_05995 [Rhizobiales bacterium 68-8]|nr:MAG: hypothetical protein BGN94_05995 [Rhizobiales bacterium 68-8]